MPAVPMLAVLFCHLAPVGRVIGVIRVVRTRRAWVPALGILTVAGGLSGCAVVTVADAAVSVAATAVKVTATVVETTVDVAAAGVKAATKDDTPAEPVQPGK